MAHTRQAAGRLLLAVGIAFAALLFHPSAASAHATLERSVPAPNARLMTEPRGVVLFFDEPVDLALGRAIVIGPSGAPVSTGHTQSAGGRVVTITLRPGLGNGAYVVSYRAVSQDAHPVSGGFYFQVGSAIAAHQGAGTAPLPPTGQASEDATVGSVYALCRYVGFFGLLLLVGGVVFMILLQPSAAPRRVVREAWLGLGLVTVASMGELVLQAPYAAGTSLTAISGADLDAVLNTRFGAAHLLRLALLAVAAPVLAALDSQERRPSRWVVASAAIIGSGLAVTWAYSGHPGTTSPGISVPSDVVHLLSVAVWVGGLVVLATAVLPLAGAGQLRATLPRWSALAMVCVVGLIVSGTAQAVLELDAWSRLADSAYGRLLLVKIGLLAGVLAMATYSRRWVRRWFATPGRGADSGGAATDPPRTEVSRLRRAVASESLLTVVAVAVAALLVEAAPGTSSATAPHDAANVRPVITRHGAYVAAVRRGNVVIHLKVDPAVAGIQYIYLGATRPDGGRIRVKQWTLTISNPALDLDHVDVPVLIDSGVGHHFVYGSFTMSTGGIWTVEVTARTSDVGAVTVSRRVAVRS